MNRNDVIQESKKVMLKYDNKPDAGGSYSAFPMQYFFQVIHGVNTNGWIDLITSFRNVTIKKDDKTYPSIKLKEGSGNCSYWKQTKMPFQVIIKEPKGFKKTTGVDFKTLLVNTPKDQDGDKYNNEYIYHFESFEEANKFYLDTCFRFNLTDFTYHNDRYTQHLNNNVPQWTKEEYYKLIKSDVI